MENAVSNKSYYSFCGNLLVTATHSASLNEEHEALLRQQAIEICNLRPRDTTDMQSSAQDANHAVVATMTTTMAANPKRSRPAKSAGGSRSRTAYTKRLLVNARERERMKILNKGFENLRNALPCYIADGHISKITTLRLAINYIKTLTEVLKDGSMESGLCGDDYRTVAPLKFAALREPLMQGAYGNTALKMEYCSPFRAAASNSLVSDMNSPHHAYIEMDTSGIMDGDYSRRV